jgi:ribulose-phosphate 3-epimerase
VKYIRKVTKLPLDVHLMIEQPLRYVDAFIEAGSDMITVHAETTSYQEVKRLALKLKRKGIELGISLNPGTSLYKIKRTLALADFILVMSVNPGFGGQKFIPAVLPKIRKLRSIFPGDISVDGGVNDKVAKSLIKAGANILASGSYIFSAKDTRKAIERIRNAAK